MSDVVSFEVFEPHVAREEQYECAARLFYAEVYEKPLLNIAASIASMSRHTLLIATNGEKIVGAANLLFNEPKEAFIGALAVDQWNRRAGVGSQLVALAESTAQEKGAESIGCLPADVEAKLFFLKRKYRPDYSTYSDLTKPLCD